MAHKTPTLFVSYNPDIEIEKSTALRLQTISSLYGTKVSLPDRLGVTSTIKDTTKERILQADLYICIAEGLVSAMVFDEIAFALRNKKKVVVLCKPPVRKELVALQRQNPSRFFVSPYDPHKDSTESILEGLSASNVLKGAEKKEPDNKALWTLLGVGVGLFLLWALSSDNDAPKKINRHR